MAAEAPEPIEPERLGPPLPGGGAYAWAFYRDADGNACPKSRARRVEIVEHDARDNPLRRVYLELTPPPDPAEPESAPAPEPATPPAPAPRLTIRKAT